MKIENKDGYTLFSTNENILQEALQAFFLNAEKYDTENIIFHISDNLNITPKDFLLFLDIASTKKENGTSFVIIIKSLDIDALPKQSMWFLHYKKLRTFLKWKTSSVH